MPFGSTFANDTLKLIFQATAIANIADNAGTSPLTSLYLSLHTSDPGASGDQTTNEISYTGYSRQGLLRSASGWTVTGNVVTPLATVSFGACTAGSGTATHLMVGTDPSGTGKQLVRGTVSPNIAVSSGITPQLTTATTITALTT